jgi:hypothetical protein
LLAVHLRQCPQHLPEFLVLSFWGGVLAALMWWQGPWAQHMVPLLWPVVGAALLSWGSCRWFRRRAVDGRQAIPAEPSRSAVAA